ncbi:hypothetical protein SEA_OCTOBIEN14_49 [Gordonia phage Octobien14]|uniref:Uncharacterized protein n=1 Tax=Gordonia phage Octobien14 TaxID=2483673 RepID=A0A3G3M9V9_9CAUD|nr:hypothetical protein L3Y22_gp049 [Gordonia phage Octobien14]AYR03195.1 hypothetical protein SEA_OCTOBIEN14_49 [Gordonia phage Octobien14]
MQGRRTHKLDLGTAFACVCAVLIFALFFYTLLTGAN